MGLGVGLRSRSMQTEGLRREREREREREMHVMFSLWGLVSTAVARKRNRAGGMQDTTRGTFPLKVKVGGRERKEKR